MRISMTGIVVIVVLAIVLFGAKRLPEVARSLGQSLRILKSEAKAMRSDGKSGEAAQAAAPPVAGDQVKTVQAAPGASATARPVAEPAAGTTASDGDRPR
ncbi:Sec-independent protein translocase subunit TatA [Kitasatospora sp. Ki12]|uniref:Sec-independent protein translocase subunit TatA n=1 Tax=Kitasatospora xanthocidica TaxID=83382 RepID=UPI0016799361|nr:Sec-independent protein translocase subunit TatA [Kitasatospora xanthocidica]GHF68910.1 Sec-independent protein translocase protein TatA [Kitasatospora xanthocidica]